MECTVTVVMYIISVEKLKNTWKLYMGYGELVVLEVTKTYMVDFMLSRSENFRFTCIL